MGKRVLEAAMNSPNTKLANIIGSRAIQANPKWRGFTAEDFMNWAQERYYG
jgi:hypothetical protein